MTEYNTVIENLDRCIGCYACEVACRKQNDLSEDQSWIRIDEIGPAMLNGRLTMDFIVSMTEDCTSCDSRLKNGLQPFCVSVCPTKALTHCNSTVDILRQIKQKRTHIARFVS